jgi:hydroxymethylpyrimidine pyrophosphatase-like HAD family hydrolase
VKKVKIEDVLEAIELANDGGKYYYNNITGKIIYIDDEARRMAEDYDEDDLEELLEWQRDDVEAAIDVEENWNNYISLPSKFDINEYDIMVQFCYSLDSDKIANQLLKALSGKGAFRRFKDTAIRLNIENKWYEFEDDRLKKIALDWCSDNGLEINR